jgi:Ran GTPase-activating protein (RanGAP) involved in mRNA processing and transport
MCDNRVCGAGAVAALAAALPLISQLVSLDLSDNEFGPAGMAVLAPALVRARCLTELRLPGCQLGDGGIQALAAGMTSITAAVSNAVAAGRLPWLVLDLSFNQITDAGIVALFAALRAGVTPRLTELYLGHNVFHTGQSLFDELAQLPHVTTLNVEDYSLAPLAGWSGFAKRLASLSIALGDSRSPHGSARIHAFAAELRSLVSLQSLNLGASTSLDDECASALASSLSLLPCLARLVLSASCLRGVSSQPLAQLLGCAPLLQTLIADRNGFEASTLAAGLNALPRTLRHLSLAENHLSRSGMAVVVAALPTLPQLDVLDLHRNAISDVEATALATALHSMPQLTTLNLYVNLIGAAGATALAAAFASGATPRLTTLSIHGNQYGEVGGAALARSFAHLPLLSACDLDDPLAFPSSLPLYVIMDLTGCAAWRDEWAVLWSHGDAEADSYRACLAAWLAEHAWLRRRQLVALRVACFAGGSFS